MALDKKLRWGILGFIALGLLGSMTSGSEAQESHLYATDLKYLPGWSKKNLQNALQPLAAACERLIALPAGQEIPIHSLTMKAKEWKGPCLQLSSVAKIGSAASMKVIEKNFIAIAALETGTPALITGYYEPEYPGSLTRNATYRWPLYSLPPDPTRYDRVEIAAGALDGQGLEILYLSNPVDGYFMQIQGSGRVRLKNGKVIRLGYAGNNKRDYVAIGKPMVEAGLIPKEKVSMQSIRAYLEAHPESTQKWLNRNPRYVFFKVYDGPGPKGALGVALTPRISVATDPGFLALGTPLWLNSAWPDAAEGHQAGEAMSGLAIAEDKGSAIEGPNRIDLFWGAGSVAEEMAGKMRVKGSYYQIVPRHWAAAQGLRPRP